MSNVDAQEFEERVLLLVPTVKDARGSETVLASEGIACQVCESLQAVCQEAARGAGALLLAVEAILADRAGHLADLLKRQQPWSDIPLIVLTAAGPESQKTIEMLLALGNVTLVKRPVQLSILISTVRAALRDRRRQYEVRSLLENEKRQADQLNQSEKRLRLMVESVKDYAIFATGVDGRISTWNPGAERLFGWTDAEIFGRDASLLFTPEDRATGVPARHLAAALANGRAEDERWHERKDGSRFFANGIATPVYDENGTHRGFTQIARDITERKRHEEALRDADRKKDEFLAMLAHELRNPLAAVRNAVTVLRISNAQENIDFAKDVVERQVKQLVRLIDDLLDVSRITNGKIRLRREVLDATAILDQAIESARPLIDEGKHELIVAMDRGNLPIKADPTRIEQIVVNLLANAAKYTRATGPDLSDGEQQRCGHRHQCAGQWRGHSPRKAPRDVSAFCPGRAVHRPLGGGTGNWTHDRAKAG